MSAHGYHIFKASGTYFDVENKYQFIRPIGHGAYGVVVSADNTDTGGQVAIKKIGRAFEDPVDAKRILREIKLMKMFNHENVIRVLDLIPPSPACEEFDEIYIVQDLMETDLHRIIYSKQPLSIDHIQYFVYQILRGLKYIHSANVLHRDLKPSNLLLNSNCDLKICDFGLARVAEEAGNQTEYVVTRWYRAPEIMLACNDYSKAIDVWSVGCIFAELLRRKALFPGDDYIAQLRLICDKLGRPSEKDLEFVTSERARRFILSLPEAPDGSGLVDLFPEHQEEHHALDLMKRMLEFHPGKRISIEDALAHPFMASLHSADDEPDADFTVEFDFEKENMGRERVQELIWEEIRDLHPRIPLTFPGFGKPRKNNAAMLNGHHALRAEGKDEGKEVDGSKASRKRSISSCSNSPTSK